MKLLRDTWLLFVYNTKATIRNPTWVVLGLFQPICFMLLFAPLLDDLTSTSDFSGKNAITFFTPGALVMLGMFSVAFVGFSLIADLRAGVIERLRVTPVSRLALLLGRVLSDGVNLLIQSLLLLLIAWLLGLRADPVGIVIALVLVLLMGLLMASCSYALALTLKDENALSSTLNTFSFPLMLLSGIILPLSLAPTPIRAIALFNPFSYMVEAARALFQGDMSNSSVLLGFVMITLPALLALYWATRNFRRAIA